MSSTTTNSSSSVIGTSATSGTALAFAVALLLRTLSRGDMPAAPVLLILGTLLVGLLGIEVFLPTVVAVTLVPAPPPDPAADTLVIC